MSVGAAGKMGPVPGVWPRPEPFAPRADPAVLEDLRARLRATRWPDAPEDAGWSLGTDLNYLRELVAYWADEFDWTAQEAALAPPAPASGSGACGSTSCTPGPPGRPGRFCR